MAGSTDHGFLSPPIKKPRPFYVKQHGRKSDKSECKKKPTKRVFFRVLGF
jgi:hypothetical protein